MSLNTRMQKIAKQVWSQDLSINFTHAQAAMLEKALQTCARQDILDHFHQFYSEVAADPNPDRLEFAGGEFAEAVEQLAA
jgi:hypothetical protein